MRHAGPRLLAESEGWLTTPRTRRHVVAVVEMWGRNVGCGDLGGPSVSSDFEAWQSLR